MERTALDCRLPEARGQTQDPSSATWDGQGSHSFEPPFSHQLNEF